MLFKDDVLDLQFYNEGLRGIQTTFIERSEALDAHIVRFVEEYKQKLIRLSQPSLPENIVADDSDMNEKLVISQQASEAMENENSSKVLEVTLSPLNHVLFIQNFLKFVISYQK